MNVQELINQSIGANPHFWYSPYYVNDTVKAMYKDLVSIDPGDRAYYTQQYAALNASLWSSYMSHEVEIKQEYAGAPVASTESIFVYMANATGLDVVSPPGFMEAVAEGNDPSAQDTAAMQQLMEGGNGTVHRAGLQRANRDAAHPNHQGAGRSIRDSNHRRNRDHSAARRDLPGLDGR